MHPNLWQYVVLLLGLGAVATAAGLAQEALRREPLKLVGYGNLGVALISLSVCANLAANLDGRPTSATWVAGAGFLLYALAALGTWIHAARRVRAFVDEHHPHVIEHRRAA